MNRNKLNALAIIAALVCPQIANAQTTIRIGVLTDMSGLYSDFSGAGSLEAAKMAAEDFMAANPDVKVEVVSASAICGQASAAMIASALSLFRFICSSVDRSGLLRCPFGRT